MTKQEILTKLAMECATWEEAYIESYRHCAQTKNICLLVSQKDWLAERERLLNKPRWADAQEGATHLAMDGLVNGLNTAAWYFYIGKPATGAFVWHPVKGGVVTGHNKSRAPISIPAGYDWRESLEERPE